MKISIAIFLSILFIIITTSCEKEVFTDVNEPPAGKNSKIIIETKPAGATIYLDGKNMGLLSNDSLVWLSSGKHTVTLKLDLYKDKNKTYSINVGDRVVYSYNYLTDPANLGTINCSTTPQGATIYLNDSLIDKKTNATLTNIFPGPFKIKVTLAGFRADSSNFKVYAEVTQKINFFLEDTTKGVSYKTSNSAIRSNNICKIVVDKNNIKWVGSPDNGVGRFDGINWKWYNKSNSSIYFEYINTLAVDQNNNLWAGASGGIMMFNGTTWINYTSNLPPQTAVKSIAIGNNNVIWFGTQNGLVSYNGAVWKTYTTLNSGLSDNYVTSVSLDSQNRVWAGTAYSGICMFDGAVWKSYTMNNMGLSVNVGNYIQDIAVDKQGVVWVAHTFDSYRGYTGGITMYDGKNWSVIQLKGIPIVFTNMIWVDKDNYKWFGTNNGIGKYMDPINSRLFLLSNSPIPGPQIETVVIDLKGDLYVGTFSTGAVKIKKGYY